MSTKKTPLIFNTADGQQLRINTISTYLKKTFGRKVVKLSIDGKFTCPNRDGSKGTGGCLFCSASGSGDMASGSGSIRNDLDAQIRLLSDKWPEASYLAYFQSHTNTYAPTDQLRSKFYEALEHPDVSGIAIATRPDCIPDDVLDLLSELNEKTFLWVELGLQSIHSRTMDEMNLCYTLEEYDRAVDRLLSRNIRVVTHLILGLPEETRNMMLDSVKHVCNKKIFGMKLHMFNLVKGSQMEKTHPEYVSFKTIDEYVDLLISALELIPPGITMHRISGDAPRSTLIAPEWSYRKRTILNTIHAEMKSRNTWQGRLTP
ncbi:MAG: TIGR01212 family radical SAM protein [Anaerovoracaceae bacterium]|nr:TIGR01212 family radical SAM protein [Anaerovoracaceae bacterium]